MIMSMLALKGITSGFAFDVDDAGGGSPPTETPPAMPASSKLETAPEKPDKGSRTFSQDEVTALAAAEKRQGKKEGEQAAVASLLAKLKKAGVEVDGLDKIETLLIEDKKRRDADLTETERLQKALELAEAVAKESQEALAQAEAKARTNRRDTAVKTALRDTGVRKEDADDAFFLMEKRGLFENLVDKDGNLDEKALNAAVEKFKKEKPAYFTPGGAGSRSNADGRVPSSTTYREQTVRREKRRNFD